MRKTRKNTQNIKQRRYKHWLVVVLLAVLPGLALAHENYFVGKDYPCRTCDSLVTDDLCWAHVSMANTIWASQRGGVAIWGFNGNPGPTPGAYPTRKEWDEAHQYFYHNGKGSVNGVLSRLAVELAWMGQDLLQVEQAVLEKCRTWPNEALQNPDTDYGLQ